MNVLALVVAVHVRVILTPVIKVQGLSCLYVLIVAVERDDQKVAALGAISCALAHDQLVRHRHGRSSGGVEIGRAVCHDRLQRLRCASEATVLESLVLLNKTSVGVDGHRVYVFLDTIDVAKNTKCNGDGNTASCNETRF